MSKIVKAAAKRSALIAGLSRAPRKAEKIIATEKKFSANNYSPLPVVFSTASGATVTDPSGKQYLDFLSAYGAVNQGHGNQRIINAAKRQLSRVSLSSRAFHSDNFATYAEFITKFFGYDRVLPMNTGAEGVETAVKLARKWGYVVKRIPKGKAQIVCCTGCFHGRTLAAISMSEDPDSFDGYQPLVPGFKRIPYGDIVALEAQLKKNGRNIAAFIAEPVQGEAGVQIPPQSYFAAVRDLCNKYNVLFIADEVQSGLGRTGKMLAIEHDNVRPDVVILAKALGGGVLPVSAVLADKEVMDVFTPGTHGSTFGGNPVANAVAIESLKVLHEKKLPQRSLELGAELLSGLQKIRTSNSDLIAEVRGRGLFCAIDVQKDVANGNGAYLLMKILAKNGLLCKTTHGHTLRLSPPLVISRSSLNRGIEIIEKSVADLRAYVAATKRVRGLKVKKAKK